MDVSNAAGHQLNAPASVLVAGASSNGRGDMVRNAQAIIQAANRHIGTAELPRGSNRGPALEQMLRGTGFKPGEPWCMYFCLACLLEAFGGRAGIPSIIRFSGSCELVAERARLLGALGPNPATGCLFLLADRVGHFHHAGIVAKVDEEAGTVGTIEGNSNDSGSREGYEVIARTRLLHSVQYLTWE